GSHMSEEAKIAIELFKEAMKDPERFKEMCSPDTRIESNGQEYRGSEECKKFAEEMKKTHPWEVRVERYRSDGDRFEIELRVNFNGKTFRMEIRMRKVNGEFRIEEMRLHG
uniref:denovo NTF2 n=1 Tax=synthetic construct TaxID=32630 RepID=UPI00097159E7|nr:Chain A, denovo NTF2 [synthetic construct]5TS4_B Chain B, denovo NTF2 [synthetic construct]5TS4_C Chain C, denovo NTF2 [synthetic construct]5TS4_D Chain D, denovo NTF2 [synthetic construct]